MNKENVIHPAHYNIPGRKECIEEMIDVFGYEKVEHFCEVNTYKYQYRHELKNGQEDLEKSQNYKVMNTNIVRRDPRFLIADRLGLDVQLQQLTEECAELIQAVNKHWRLEGKGQPLRPEVKRLDVEMNLIEELADVKLVIDEVIFLLACEDEIKEMTDFKVARTIDQIGIPVKGGDQ